ncbi:MAG: VWA domain-containing protein [Bacteroidota bacterium]
MKAWLGIDLFANPEALVLLFLLPLYLFWYIRFYQPQRLVIRLSYDPSKLQQTGWNFAFMRHLPRTFQLLAVALLILAIARPQSADEIIEEKVEAIDIMVLLDISGSMESTDFLPNRLESAKSHATSFVRGRPQDRMGLILFASDALTYAPLTLDHNLLSRMIQSVSFNLIPRQGTAIGSAIGMGINRMAYSDNNSRVMVLLTDGANNRGELDPITAAKLAREQGIRIYTIGMGRDAAVPVVEKNMPAIPSDLDLGTLKRISAMTGGKFFHAGGSARLQQVFAEISQLETRKIQNITYRYVQDRYPIFVKVAIILLGLSFLMMLTFVYNPLEQ